ncbi:cyclic nucleotide-binding domain-containing protein [Actinomadura macrotermitis]|uniref:Cyclic nucleotide-binding domain-containing protein n=1 Tax=Actinomadura macrotermitis TaxID=2585200 RepID=A0A7K0BTU8_9ACTN|nr:cyclic nucleotide-binding domain-containing protein [Actinomadura macrotermitis]MQY04615.1 hypothetical protein [Actinomadura macrotermitis]
MTSERRGDPDLLVPAGEHCAVADHRPPAAHHLPACHHAPPQLPSGHHAPPARHAAPGVLAGRPDGGPQLPPPGPPPQQPTMPPHGPPPSLSAQQPAVTPRPAERGPSQPFWASLTDVEREEFAGAAERYSAHAGQLLWRERDTADHVLVIRSGWVKVCVTRDGRERIIAVRGAGHLIGERATLLLRERSADVVALGEVEFLRMPAGTFLAFLSAYPRILAVLERQMYDRLTEDPSAEPFVPAQRAPAWHSRTGGHARPDVRYLPGTFQPHAAQSRTPHRSPARPHASRPRALERAAVPVRLPGWSGQMCTILYTDIVGFSGAHRNDDDRLEIRRVMYDLLQDALEASGVPWGACHSEDRGDGALVVVPPEMPTRSVIDPMLARLSAGLRRHNRGARAGVRIQLRAAVDVGPVMPDAQGVSGWVIIRTARLLDAAPFKREMARTGADLGFITSEFVHEAVIAHAPGFVSPALYRQVRAKVKESEVRGWMYLSPRNR